jgi:hypothetical protein
MRDWRARGKGAPCEQRGRGLREWADGAAKSGDERIVIIIETLCAAVGGVAGRRGVVRAPEESGPRRTLSRSDAHAWLPSQCTLVLAMQHKLHNHDDGASFRARDGSQALLVLTPWSRVFSQGLPCAESRRIGRSQRRYFAGKARAASARGPVTLLLLSIATSTRSGTGRVPRCQYSLTIPAPYRTVPYSTGQGRTVRDV